MPLSPQDQDNLYKLWLTVNKDYELPDFETFKADMQDTTNRRKLWETVGADYELPDYDTFQSDMGFDVATTQVKDEKKKNIQPKAEAGGGFSAGLDRQYLDHFVTATDNVFKKSKTVTPDFEEAYFSSLKKNQKFSDEQINYVREQYKAKKQQAPAAEGKEWTGGAGKIGQPPAEDKEWTGGVGRFGEKAKEKKPATPTFDLEKFNSVMDRQKKLASGEMTKDAYAEEIKREADDAYVAYQKKVREESADFYLTNADNYDDKFGGLYLAYLKEKNPERFNQIQNQIVTGNWDKGADPAKKVMLEQLGKEYKLPFLGQAYEIYANIIGENSLENTAQLYKEALNWKAESENAAYERISKNPLMQEAKILQDQQKQFADTQNGQVLIASSKALEQLSKTPEVQEFVALGEKGAANGNKLEGADWDRYQELKNNPSVVKYAQSIQQYQQAAQTPEGQKFAEINQQLQALYDTPDFQNLAAASDVLARNSANTQQLVESYTKKFPKQAFAEAYYKAEQQKVDAYYKRMSPVLRTFANMLSTLGRVPAAITGEIAAGATRAAAGVGAMAGGEETVAGVGTMYDLNSAADLITSVAEGLNSNMFPQPTNLQLPMFDQYAPYNGYRVYTNKRNEVIDVRDADGYAVDEMKAAGVAKAWEYETNRPAKVNATNSHMILPRITQTAADLIVLAMAPEAGALVNLGHKASMVTYGYLTNYNTAYEEIKAADPFISESAAHLYANTKGIMMGGLLTLTPKTFFPGKDGNIVWKEIGKEYTGILAGGTPANIALAKSMSKVMGKEGVAMTGIGFAMDLSDRGLKLAANALTNRPTQETEYTFNQALETGVSMFVTGAIMVGFNKGFKGLRGDALYTGLKNYERTIGDLEQMANRGEITQQDFARASGMLSQLKLIYDNLADMGKFNDAYKSSLIGLYAEKLRVEEKLGKATTIEALQKGANPERDALVQELNQIDAKIERLAIINNPEFVVYTESVKATEQVDVELQSILEKLNRGEELSRAERVKLQNQKYYVGLDGKYKIYPPGLKIEVSNQYVYDPVSGKFIAVSGAIGREKPGETPDTEPGVEVIGARVAMPEYFAEGQRVTRDQLLEMVKDPEFLSDLQAGRKTLSIFNDLEIQAYVERLMPRQKPPIGPERQVGEQKKLTGRSKTKGLLGEATVETIGDSPIRPIGGGPAGKIEVTDTGVYFTDINGKSKQLAVADKTNPTETLSELGYEVVIQPEAPGLPAPVAVELLDDNVSFNIDGNKVTWLKFNYGNNGELQTADVLTPEGRKIKIKDRDVVYDMAVQLSNNSRTRLAIPRERVSEDITEAVKSVKEGFDLGMKAIDTIFSDVDPVVEAVLEGVEMGMEVDADDQAAAELWLEDAIRRTEKIDTQNVEEKQRVVEWAKGLLGEIGTAKIAAKRPVQPEPAAEGVGGKPVAEREPVAPTEQRTYEFPELPSRAKALVKRLAGTKGEAEAERIVTTIKEAYQAEKAPAEELAKIGYGKQEYVKAVGEVVEALKPTVKTVPITPAAEGVKPEEVIEEKPLPSELESRSVSEGERLSEFKKGDVVFRDYGGKYEEYRIISDKGDLWKLENTETGKELTLNAINNGGFVLKSEGVEIEPPAEYKYTAEQKKLYSEINELKTILNAGSINGRKLSKVEKGKLETKLKELETQLATSLEVPKTPVETTSQAQFIGENPVAGTAEVGQYRPEFQSDIIKTGKQTTVILANGERIPAKYAIVKLGDIIPSHDPFAFVKSKGYPVDEKGRTTNDRDYENDKAAQTTTIKYGANPDNAKLLDLTNSPATGPSVITMDGFVVGGNGRVMAMNRMSAANGVRYNMDLAQQAADFGFTEIPTYNAKQPISELPVVVRIVETTDQYSKANSAKYNAEEGKVKSEADTSLTFGANLTSNPRAKELLYAELGKYDTMGEFFANPKSIKFTQDVMLGNDLVQEKDINRFFDANGRWTTTGKELFRQGVFATLFNEEIVRLTDSPGVASFIDRIIKNLPSVAENFNLPPDKNLKKELEDAIRFQSAFVNSGIKNINDFIRQNYLFDKPYLEQAILWGLIDISTAKNNYFRKAIDSYNNSVMSDMGGSLFQEEVARTKKEFFTLITKQLPDDVRKSIESSLISQGFGPAGQGEISEPYERYARKSRDGGLLGFTANEPVFNESKVGQSQKGSIDNDALSTFVKAVGVKPDGTVRRKFGEHWGDIPLELSKIPGNIEVYREVQSADMLIVKKGKGADIFRFKIDGVPFNPVSYLKTGRIEGEAAPGLNVVKQLKDGQLSDDVGFTEKEKNYRQEQLNFGEHPDTRTVEIKNDTPLKFRSIAEIQEQSLELTGKELTTALAESKLQRKLKEGEYIHKTSKISISKDWNIWRKTGEIKAPVDVAYMFRQLEDYNSEQMMLAMIDGDGKLHVAHVGTGSANAALANIQKIMDFVLSFNAKKFWWIHNHPSGALDTSEGDRLVNANINRAAASLNIDFQGGIVVNWDKSAYTYFDPYGINLEYGKTYLDYPEAGASEQVPVYQNHIDSRNQSIPKNNITNPQDVVRQISSMVTQTKAGEAVKGGVLLLNNQNRVIGHLFLNGYDDISTITKGVAATNAVALITYGTFTEPIVTVGRNYMDARVLDHIVVESKTFGKYDITSTAEPDVVFSTSANDIPNVRDITLPYGDKAPKLEKAVQKAMLDGFVTFDEVIFNLYTDFYQGDAAKIRQNLQKIKDAYDEVGLLDEFLDTNISSIDDVARFDLDKFLISVNRPQKTETSLRQQYNDFASWFEYNYPEYKFYYNIDIDPDNGQVYFRIGKDPIKMTNGNVLYYGDWVSNKKWQREWHESQKSEVFSRPPMVWVDKEITPTPYEHVKKDQYAIGEDQEVAVNLILDRFIPKTPGKEPKRGFMLGDGMGIGKTRIELVSANEMIKAKNLPVLIITKGANVVEQFQREAAALSLSNVLYRQEPKNVNEPKIVVGTYDDLTNGKLGNADKYAVVIFDESHMLKNRGTQRSMTAQQFLKKTEHVVFATGTPMDKPVQLAYFIQHMTGKDMDESLKPVGLYMDEGRLKKLPDAPDKPIKELFLMWRSNMIKEGAYIRREYPFFGTADRVYISFERENATMLERIKIGNGRNAVMAANRYQEHLKIPYILGETIKAVNEGKQVVIFCVGVNDTIIFPDGKKSGFGIEVPQFAKEFSRKLKDAGIDHATIYGADASAKLEESRKFQRGDVKVAIATISSGGTGIDLDDQFGDAPREVIFATLPWSGNEFDQAQFRVSRRNTKTPSRMRFLFAENSWADKHKENLVNRKMETLRLIQAGKDPDLIDMERWREDADGGLIDIVEDDFNDQDENVSNPDDNQYVEAITAPPIEVTETPNEVKEKFDNGDPATLQAVGELPAPIGGESEYIRVTAENKSNPEQEGTVEPTTPLGAASTKNQPTTIGGAKTTPTVQQRRSWWKSFLFGPPKQKSLSTMVLEIYQKLGIPTRGEYHMNPRYLGYYSHVTKDVSLKVAADIFVALHEAIHWADFSKLGGITNKIINNNDVVVIKTLSAIHDKFYPGARKSAPLKTKVAEGLTMYMQMKLYDPDKIAPFVPVTNAVFTPGGQYYDPIWDDIFDAFEGLKNNIAAMSPLMQASLTIADMNTPKSKDYTIDTWNFLAKRLFKNYDESIPLSLWDDKAGVGFGTAMERTDDKGKLIQSAQNAYFFFRNRNRLASNWVNYDPTFLNALLPSNPMFYDTNGQWTAGKYRMADTINALKKLEKSNPDILTDDIWNNFKVDRNEAMDITKAYSTYLVMRRMFMDYQKRKDLETLMQVIIGDGMRDYLDLIHTSDPNLHAQRLGEFKSNHLEPFKEAFNNWKKINELIGNEGGTYVELSADFSPTLLAWSSPQFRNLHSKLYDPNLGNLKSDANATQVYQRFSQQFAEADKSFDYINQTMLRMMVATGMLSQKSADQYVEDNTKYPGYASFQRYVSNTFFDDPELVQIVGSDNVGKIRSTLQRKGSSADIIDPVLSQAVMVHEVFRKGLKNLMWLRLANMSRTDEQLSRGLIPIPTRYKPEKNSKGEVMYRKPVIVGKADIPGQILIYADGVGKYYQIADESLLAFYNVITELDGGKAYSGLVNSRIYKAGVSAAAMFTVMTTGVYPLWAIQNLTVDQLSAAMNSKLGTIPIYTSAKNFLPAFGLAMGNLVGKQLESFAIFQKMFPGQRPTPRQLEYITEFMSMGGSSQTMMAQLMSDEQKATVQDLFEIKPKGLLPKIKFGVKRIPKVVTWTVDFTSLPTNLSEVVTRFSEYAQARERGMSMEAAFRHSIETMPFAKRGAGKWVRIYFPLVSYLRSSFTVAGKTLEEAIDQPKKFATVWTSLATATAIAFINFWEGLEEDEKNYYLQADGTELSQYFIIPARFMGGPENTMYRFRISEIIGSASAVGMMYGISMVTTKPVEYKQMAKAIASNIPAAINPYEWAAGDTSFYESIKRQGVRVSPQILRPLVGSYSGKTPSTSGTRPITPRSLEFYPSEFQYRIGSRGTSSVVKDISDNLPGPFRLSPIQTEYLMGEYFGRTGRFILDLIDEKEIKSAFIREREDYALRGRWYQDFYEKNSQMRARMTVINTIRDPKPSPKNVVMYEKWKDNLRTYAKEYTMYSAVDELLAEAYKVREHAVINDVTLPLFVYDKFDEMVKSFYDNEPYDVRKKKVNEAFDMLKDAANSMDYKNVRFFAPTPYSVKFTGSEITKYYNKLYKQ